LYLTAVYEGESKMPSELPNFIYHPDPIATGSVVVSDESCICCGRAPGLMYAGPVYSRDSDKGKICPWCIADGTAHAKLFASFTDPTNIGGGGEWDHVSQDVIDMIAYRTPGFCGWQEERWWTHCNDAAEFIGRAGRAELEALGSQALAAIRENAGLSEGREWNKFLAALHKDRGPTAYLFRCRKCGRLGGYQDCH
jgi:uncharacterized protein CbrC (UPF0167 family)